MHACILRDPHLGVRGPGAPTPANAVCDGLKDAVGRLTSVWVADGGNNHSASHDPAYEPWLLRMGFRSMVVMGFDADICVCGNVFGVAEPAENFRPPKAVPALLNFADVVTSRPLLSGSVFGVVQDFAGWGNLADVKGD